MTGAASSEELQRLDIEARHVTECVSDLLVFGGAASERLAASDEVDRAEQLRRQINSVVEGQMRIAVVGEFNSGKSTLVNALLGANVAAVDSLRSTEITLEVRHGDEFAFTADLDSGRQQSTISLEPDAARHLQLQAVPELDGHAVRAIRATVPAGLLGSGLRLVDTPSVSGGISSPTGASILAELMQSHAWLFVTDSSQELTGPELELIKIGCSLCPNLIIVATKCDVTAEWKRLIELDRTHVASLGLDPLPIVLGTAAPLRSAALRLADPTLDDESGLPLLTWYLTRATTLTARRVAAASATDSVVRELESVERVLTDRIDMLQNSGERARLLEESANSRARCEELATSARGAIQRSIRAFDKRVSHDLQDSIATVRREVADDIKKLEGERDWPKIERRVQADVNRLLASHLATIATATEDVVEAVAADLGLTADEIAVTYDLDLEDHTADRVTGQLDQPLLPTSAMSRLQPVLVSARVGVTGASGVGLGISSGLLAGVAAVAGIALVPVAAAGTAWWMRQKSREQSSLPWKHAAAAELNRFLDDCYQMIGRCSTDVRDDVLDQLPPQLEQRLQALATRFADEHERLSNLAGDRAGVHQSEVDEIEQQRHDVRLIATHARRLGHRLASPGADDDSSMGTETGGDADNTGDPDTSGGAPA